MHAILLVGIKPIFIIATLLFVWFNTDIVNDFDNYKYKINNCKYYILLFVLKVLTHKLWTNLKETYNIKKGFWLDYNFI